MLCVSLFFPEEVAKDEHRTRMEQGSREMGM